MYKLAQRNAFFSEVMKMDLAPFGISSSYADDTAIFNDGKTVKEVQTNLQDDFDTICKWLDLNNMHIHPQKTKVVAFGHRK